MELNSSRIHIFVEKKSFVIPREKDSENTGPRLQKQVVDKKPEGHALSLPNLQPAAYRFSVS